MGNPGNGACIGGGVGHGPLTSWDLVLRYETGLSSYRLYPNPNALQDFSSSPWVYGLVFVSFSPNNIAWYCMENQVFLPAHLGHCPGLASSPVSSQRSVQRPPQCPRTEEWNLGQRKRKETDQVFLFPSQGGCFQASFTPLFPLSTAGLWRKGNWVQPQAWV